MDAVEKTKTLVQIKVEIIAKEVEELQLLRDLRAVRGEIEALRRKLEER